VDTRPTGNGGNFNSTPEVTVLDPPQPLYSVSLAQIGAATFACGPVLTAVAIAVGRFTPVIVLDLLGCCLLAAALLAAHHLSGRPAAAPAGGRLATSLRNFACLSGFAIVGIAIVVSYNVQVAGPNASAGTISGIDRAASALRPEQPQGTTNITVHCENGKVDVGSRRSR
jgi:hypothetical protein